MKYDIETSLGEIMKRGNALTVKKHKKAATLTGVLSGLIFCLMATVFYRVNNFYGPGMISSTYGSFLLSREAGLYVFLSVIFFVLGVVVSLGIIKINEGKKLKKEERTNDKTR